MKKGSKILGITFIILAIACIVLYFLYSGKASEYKVTFDSDGGSVVAEQIVPAGGKATEPDKPTKDKSDFVEWQLDGKAYDFNNSVDSNITLKAIWESYKEFSVKITIDSDDYTANIREGKLLTLESFNIPTKEGYNVKLYTTDGKEYDQTLSVTSDLELSGKYVEMQQYTVKFNSNGGTKVSDVKVVEGSPVSEPTVTRDGYVLDGWYLNDEKYDFSTPITKGITLKAKWNEGAKHTVVFNVDGKSYKTSSVLENTKVSKPTPPTKTGYKFVEWQLDGNAFDFNTKITEDITLTAKFEEITSHIVKFDSDGGTTVKQQEVEVGKKATRPTDPTKSGSKFSEWQLNGKTYNFDSVVTSDITLKAKWLKEYTVTFNKDNGTNNDTQIVVEGNTVTRPTDPTKDGHVFEEWLYNNQTFDFSTPITKDITLTARYRSSTANPDIPVNEENN